MNGKKIILLLAALAMMAGGAGFLWHLKNHQRLGAPGVRFEPLGGGRNVRVVLPERVLDYESVDLPQDSLVTNTLPADTSYGQRRYFRPGAPEETLLLSVVLMGTDRTSIHKPQYCLGGMGWQIDNADSRETTIPIPRPQAYDLPVIKLLSSRTIQGADGQPARWRGLYVYWFVADDALSGDMAGWERMWWMARHLLRTGELQRWAYVACFAVCPPGQEEATFERVKTFLAAAVPEFQLTPKPGGKLAAQP